MEKLVSKLFKIGDHQFMELFFYTGEMFFNTVEAFKKKDENQERFDHLEGAIDILQVDWFKLKDVNGKIFEFSKFNKEHIHLSSAYRITYNNTESGSIFSCTAVTPDTVKNFYKLDPRFQNFGDSIILIEDPTTFIDRVTEELKRQNYDFEYGLVNYFNPNTQNGALGVFDKKILHSYQSEFRIWIKNSGGKPVKIRIGSIEDIAIARNLKSLYNN